ncbi:MAG: hypothetical protein R6X02_35740 [Enhygromyxa sp.]
MALVEASSSSRAICRECGSTIEAGEPRYGQDEGSPDARRTRWRHLACAAQAFPEALLRALELGGWEAVPEDDHEELRGLIDRAITAPQSSGARSQQPAEPRAARSNSAMAAAAVLEPAHEAAELSPARDRAWVLADSLQVRGDPRGELLALELAAEHTDDPLQARTLWREHHACQRAHPPALRASASLRLRWIGGFLLGGYPRDQRELHRLLASPAASSLARVRVDFCTHEELTRLVDVAKAHRRPLSVVDLPSSRSSDLRALAGLERLVSLRIGGRFDPAALTELTQLRSLSVVLGEELGVAELEPLAAELETLELRELQAARLEGLGRRLPGLRRLTLAGARFDGEPELLCDALGLRALRMPDSPLRSLGPIAELPELRELELVPGKLHLLAELGALTGLERLALAGSKVDELEPLAALRACERLSLIATRVTRLEPLASLPRLRDLALEGGDLRRISGLERLTGLERLLLARVANVDLAALLGFERLHTLVLDPGGARPRSLDSLASLPSLRRLSLPVELLGELWTPQRVLANIEVLELSGDRLPEIGRVARLPRLRKLLLPERDPKDVQWFAERLPKLRVVGELAPLDRLGRRDPFDWRSVDWPQG